MSGQANHEADPEAPAPQLSPQASGPRETRLRNAVDLGSSGLSAIVVPLAASRVKHAVAANLDTLNRAGRCSG